MEILTKIELKLRYEEILNKIKNGAIFIHPTDTIYGLGCHALDEKAVQKIRNLKDRPDNPFSIWVPSPDWITKNCVIDQSGQSWLAKLPGPYTLILKLKNKNCLPKNVNCNLPAIGVRYPDHWFSNIVHDLGFPIITTSANKANQPFMTSIENLDHSIETGVEFMISEGEKSGRPSKIIDLIQNSVKER